MTEPSGAKYRHDYNISNYTISQVDLEFHLDKEKTKVIARSQCQRLVAEASNLLLDGDQLILKSVQINGNDWSAYEETNSGLLLSELPEFFELLIETEINPLANTALEGLYFADGAFCTQCEAEGFRRITYFLDRPDVLAKYSTKIVASKADYPFLMSNGNPIGRGDLANGCHWVQWEDPFAKPSYLFALVAGDFDVLRDTFITCSNREVALEIYVDKGNLHRADFAMTSLKNAMKWDEERFNLEYDLDIYMIVAVDFFNMGAMENKGLNVFNSVYVLADKKTATDANYGGIEAVIGHEYFHNWTGNRVTCRDWFQLSLKEGLTVFRDQEFSSDMGVRAVERIQNVRTMRGPQFAEDASPMAHPIRPEKVIEMNNFYTLTVYEKGSEVIRMIHTLLGEENFQAGMALYFERHDGTAATCEDFVKAMEDASGVDLTQFRLWYSQSGTPELAIESHYDPVKKQLELMVSQHTPATKDQAEKQALHIPLKMSAYGASGQLLELKHPNFVNQILHVTQEKQTFVFEGILEAPVLSLLEDFSAPVKLHYAYTDEELSFLILHANNDFSRWDACQMLLAKHLKQAILDFSTTPSPTLPKTIEEALRGVLNSRTLAPALIAELFTLPNENEIAGWFTQVDPDAIHAVRCCYRQEIATRLSA